MAFLNEEFSVDTLPAASSGDFEPIPAGWYNARIVKADLQDTKSGTGQYIKLRLDVTGPSYQGRVMWANLNIRNSSSKAEEIGRAQLSAILQAIGLPKISDTDQLISGELQIKVEVKSDDYGTGNEVKAYKALEGRATPSAPASKPAAAPTQEGAKKSPPWAKK
jgi:hypothetical protein